MQKEFSQDVWKNGKEDNFPAMDDCQGGGHQHDHQHPSQIFWNELFCWQDVKMTYTNK